MYNTLGRLNLKPFQKETSILDEPRATLDLAIWDISDELPKLRPSVKEEIIDRFLRYIETYGGYFEPEKWIDGFYYTGSTATKRYTSSSDVDIHVLVDWSRLIKSNPDKKGDPREMWRKLQDIFWWTLNRETLPGTKHPITYFVIPPGEEARHLETTEEAYDMQTDRWLVAPKNNDEPPVIEMEKIRNDADEIMNRVDLEIAKTKKGLIDYAQLKDILSDYDGDGEDIKKRLQDKLVEIEEALMSLKDEYDLLKDKRKDGFLTEAPIVDGLSQNWTPGNILFKLVERYKYMDVLRKVKKVLSDKEMALTDKEIPSVVDALTPKFENKLTLRKTAQIDQQTFFDFYGLTLLPKEYLQQNPEVQKYRDVILQIVKDAYVDYFKKDWGEEELAKAPSGAPLVERVKSHEGDTYSVVNIVTCVKRLMETTQPDEAVKLIDLINDAEHQTGSYFLYAPQMQQWISQALAIKASQSPQQLLPYMSSDVQDILRDYLKATGQSYISQQTDWSAAAKYITQNQYETMSFRKQITPEMYEYFKNSPDAEVRAMVVLDDRAPLHVRTYLAQNDQNDYMASNVLLNREKIPVEVWQALLQNPDPDVQAEIQKEQGIEMEAKKLNLHKTAIDLTEPEDAQWGDKEVHQDWKLQRTNKPRYDDRSEWLPDAEKEHHPGTLKSHKLNLQKLSQAPIIEYDEAGRVAAEKYPDGTEVRYEYDVNGNLIHEKSSGGVEVWYSYDEEGNKIFERWHDGTQLWYDKEGNVIGRRYFHDETGEWKEMGKVGNKGLNLRKTAQFEAVDYAKSFLSVADQRILDYKMTEWPAGAIAQELITQNIPPNRDGNWNQNMINVRWNTVIKPLLEEITRPQEKRAAPPMHFTPVPYMLDGYIDPNILISAFEARDSGIVDYEGTRDYVYQDIGRVLTKEMWKILQEKHFASVLLNGKMAYFDQPKLPYDNRSYLEREPGPPESGQTEVGPGQSEEMGAANDDQWSGGEYDGLSNKPSTPGWTRKPEREKHLPEFNDTWGWPGGQVRQVSRDNMIKLAENQLDRLELIDDIVDSDIENELIKTQETVNE